MKKRIFKLCLLCVYCFTSNAFLHAGIMAHHDMLVTQEQAQPCHEENNTLTTSPVKSSGDCFEKCMGAYKDIGGICSCSLKQFIDFPKSFFVNDILSSPVVSLPHFARKNDPPPLTLMGYTRAGKEIRKLE